jgi:hypothetical protein
MAGEDERRRDPERAIRDERRRVEPEREPAPAPEPQIDRVREELRRHDTELRADDDDE